MDSFPDQVAVIEAHLADSYQISWGVDRALDFNVYYGGGTGLPSTWFDGWILRVGGSPGMNYVSQYNSAMAVPTDVTIELGATQISGPTYDVTARVCIEPGGTGKTMRVHIVQVLDKYPSSDYNGCLMQGAASQDVTVSPGGCQDVTRTFTFDAASWANQDRMRLIAWAEQISGGQDTYQAAVMPWPFLSEIGSTAFPFSDDFPTATIDTAYWTGIDDATSSSLGINEPSASFALRLNGTATGGAAARTARIDTSPIPDIEISYWVQRTGGGDSPETGDDLVVEYLQSGFPETWVEIARYPGSGADETTFTQAIHPLGAAALHSNFRLQFRVESSEPNLDDWFVDDVAIYTTADLGAPQPDPMTFDAPPVAVSATEMTMTATTAVDTEGAGVEYYFDKIGGLPGSDSGWIASPTFNGTGLRPNSTYSYSVKARDTSPQFNETAESTVANAATLIESPTTVSFANITGTSAYVIADGTFTDLVAAGAGLFFEMTPAGGSGANVWVQAQSINVTGLSMDTEYTVRVKARNLEGTETGWSAPNQVTTLDVAIPGPPTLSNETETSMDLDIDPNGNLGSTTYAIQCASSSPFDANWDGLYVVHANGTPSAGEDWAAIGATITITGLQSDTTYEFHVKARNAALVETPFGPSSSLATVTLQVPGSPVLSGATPTTVNIDIVPNGNSPQAVYAIQCSSSSPLDSAWDGMFVDHATGAPVSAEDWQIDSGTITATSLTPNTTYEFHVKAGAGSGSETAYGPTSAVTTPALAPGPPILTPGVTPPNEMDIDVVPDADPSFDNPADTEFLIQCTGTNPPDATWDGMFVDAQGAPSAVEAWQTDAAWGTVTAGGLQLTTEYTFATKARDRNGIETATASAFASTDSDCNANNTADTTDIASCAGDPACEDCNTNGIPDGCDVGGPLDQWATSVSDFSSEYDLAPPGYLAIQTLGLPDVPFYGDHPKAWSPLLADDGDQYVTVLYGVDVYANAVTVRENLNNGYVIRVEVVKASDNSLVEVWPLATGETDTSLPGVLSDFTASFAETAFLVSGVRVTIDTNHVAADWEEIDAIQLHGVAPGSSLDINGDGVPDECSSLPCSLLGDMDGNALINGADIGGYVRVKLDVPEPGDQVPCADFGNGDVTLDTADFVSALIN